MTLTMSPPSPPSTSERVPLQDHHHITVTLQQAFSLMRALLSLKCLQSIDTLLKASRRTQTSAPATWTRQRIARKERRITDIFLYIIPQHVYRSVQYRAPPATAAVTTTTPRAPEENRVIQVPRPIYAPPAIHIAEYLTESGEEEEDVKEVEVEQEDHGEEGVELQVLSARTARDPLLPSESIYSVSREESSSFPRALHQHAVSVSAGQYVQTLPPREWYSSTGHPWSIDSVALPMSSDSLAFVELEHVRKSMSAESFPGRFPISDGLECGSLATSRNVLGRGATSVRPFSEF